MEEKERLRYFDVAKGGFMLLLLLCHMPDAADEYGVELPYAKLLTSWQSAYTAFFMQAFFFISGYCTNFRKPFVQFITDLSKRILVPIVSFTVLILAVDACLFGSTVPLQNLLDPLLWLRGWLLWFLYAIFVAKCIIWLFTRTDRFLFAKYFVLICFVFLGIWLNKILYWGNYFCIYHALVASLFIYLGYRLRKADDIYKFCLKYLGLLYIPILVAIKLLHLDIPTITWGLNLSLYHVPIFIITALTGTFFALRICQWIKENRFLELWGRNSLLIYGINFFCLGIVCSFVYRIFVPDNYFEGFIAILAVFLVTMMICSLASLLAEKIKYGK